MRSRLSQVGVLAAMLLGLAGSMSGSGEAAPAQERLGTVHFPVSCGADVQPDFDRAVALLHHMTYPQARAAFEAIGRRDPACAMAQWGVAMTLFQPLWPTRPSREDLRRGWNAVEQARHLGRPTERERLFLAAAAAFFRDPDTGDYWERIGRWEQAMAAVHERFPEDPEATAFYALALLASAPPGPALQEHSGRAADLLRAILLRNPDHPGAMHYLVHADDVPGREHEDLAVVNRYEQAAPENPHALHMPTHIYTRLGDWDAVIAGNVRAAEAALRYRVGPGGDLVWDEFPHAIEYLVYAYLQEGSDDRAAAEVSRLQATERLEPSAKTAFHLASTRARYALERHAWAEAAALVARESRAVDWDRFPWPEAVAWFARGYGAARLGNSVSSRQADARLRELEARAGKAGEDVFARQIQILRLELEGWNAQVAGDSTAALSLLRQAVELEASTPKPAVTPAPTVPASELLGDLLAELERPREALAAYRESLRRYPRRFNGTLGAARSLAGMGDWDAAGQEYCELLTMAPSGTRPALAEARRFMKDHPMGAMQDCPMMHGEKPVPPAKK